MNGRSVLVIGGTGSFGQKAVETLLSNHTLSKLVVFSRDEAKQFFMAREFPDTIHSNLRYFIGDIRDKGRLEKAFYEIDYVIHAAALKQVPSCEYNPFEAVKTNILGTQNVIDAAIEARVKKVIFLSTDKAVEPCNLYGMTKGVAEKLVVNADMYSRATKFAVVRYGNVMGSRGSVIPYFKELADRGEDIPITCPTMTRFWITLDQAVSFVLSCLDRMTGGEIFIPKLPSMNIVDLAEAIAPRCNLKMVGTRPGEKVHEKLISINEKRVVEEKDRFVIRPVHNIHTNDEVSPITSPFDGQEYTSDHNPITMSVEMIQKVISKIKEE